MEHLHSVWDIPSRGVCWMWTWWLLAPFMLGNLLTAAAYFYIPALLWRIGRGRPGRWLTKDAFLGALFIVLCGAGHFIGGVLLVFWGLYPLAVGWDFATGVVSWAFAVRFRRKVEAIISAPDGGELIALREFWERRQRELREIPLAPKIIPRETDDEVGQMIGRTIQVLDRALVRTGATA